MTISNNESVKQKPRSMTPGQKNIVRSNDSASLWNYTLSPGWNLEEVEILRSALMKFGIGNWAKIIESKCLNGKTIAQMNLQTQRLLGQQSTAEFAGLHIDPKIIYDINIQKQGEDVKRKNGFIINTGDKISREELHKRQIENKKYELPKETWQNIILEAKIDPFEELALKREKLIKLEEHALLLAFQITEIEKEITFLSKENNENQLDIELDEVSSMDASFSNDINKKF